MAHSIIMLQYSSKEPLENWVLPIIWYLVKHKSWSVYLLETSFVCKHRVGPLQLFKFNFLLNEKCYFFMLNQVNLTGGRLF